MDRECGIGRSRGSFGLCGHFSSSMAPRCVASRDGREASLRRTRRLSWNSIVLHTVWIGLLLELVGNVPATNAFQGAHNVRWHATSSSALLSTVPPLDTDPIVLPVESEEIEEDDELVTQRHLRFAGVGR